jgi:hypothetical protein
MFNRKIRAWHPKLQQLYKVAVLDFERGVVKCEPFMGTSKREPIFDINEVQLTQDSGLVDIYQFSVFEEDIVDFEGTACVLKYGHYGNTFSGSNGFGWYLECGLARFPYLGGGQKVGNVFDNPELLKRES